VDFAQGFYIGMPAPALRGAFVHTLDTPAFGAVPTAQARP
jgi:hypothetical protein